VRYFYLDDGLASPGARVEQLTPREAGAPTFESVFGSRPSLWMAVRATDPKVVQSALGLNQPTPCSWKEGMTGEKGFFVGPP